MPFVRYGLFFGRSRDFVTKLQVNVRAIGWDSRTCDWNAVIYNYGRTVVLRGETRSVRGSYFRVTGFRLKYGLFDVIVYFARGSRTHARTHTYKRDRIPRVIGIRNREPSSLRSTLRDCSGRSGLRSENALLTRFRPFRNVSCNVAGVCAKYTKGSV